MSPFMTNIEFSQISDFLNIVSIAMAESLFRKALNTILGLIHGNSVLMR